jgi:hypothetical protein
MVEWDTLGQVIRRATERLPYSKGAGGEASLQSIGIASSVEVYGVHTIP